eukprot:gene28582-31750_t
MAQCALMRRDTSRVAWMVKLVNSDNLCPWCGSYIAAGEGGAGAQLHVWEISSCRCVASLKASTKYGVGSLCFSPDGKMLVSAGSSYDGHVLLWDWQAGSLLAKQYTSAEVLAVGFNEDGTCVYTVGRELFKVWTKHHQSAAALVMQQVWTMHHQSAAALVMQQVPDPNTNTNTLIVLCLVSLDQVWTMHHQSAAALVMQQVRASHPITLSARPASLRELRAATFVDLQFSPTGGVGIYALTSAGVLVMMRGGARSVEKSVSLRVSGKECQP